MYKNYNQSDVESMFKLKQLTVVDTYKNNKTPIKYICKCGSECKIRLDSFLRGANACNKCVIKPKPKTKHTQEYIEQYLNTYNFKLLSQYVNAHNKIDIVCPNNHIITTTFNRFRNGRRCAQCSRVKKLTHEYVLSYMADFNYTLLSQYKNCSTKLDTVCPNNHNWAVKFQDFVQGYRCKQCYLDNNRGINHPRWNSNRNISKTIRMIHSSSHPYKQQYRRIHNNLDTKNYHVDHIFPIKAFVEHGIYDLDIINHVDNLQLIPMHENTSKRGKYDIQKFEKYLIDKNLNFTKT